MQAGQQKRDAERAQVLNYTENLASKFVEKIRHSVDEFMSNLQPDEEIGIQLVTFQSMIIHVTTIGWNDPNMIRFIGYSESGSPVELIQHVSQCNFLLTAVKALEPEEPTRKIGFIQG
ncbi:hypothetical protein JJB07_14785 [Tumebacillus sp. ITR2]|uniref:Uncharacterized protein n=2 Tax=Tumebacillus amylolyticus TaxID=2801339 RepID=A0ABS1JCZ6_9BACL|nr:hypothetical protein [Tumebacillus amylolyticus]